eukprot:COSAG02_NODE_61_length_43452_cov_741.297804_22_plen_75_part_00
MSDEMCHSCEEFVQRACKDHMKELDEQLKLSQESTAFITKGQGLRNMQYHGDAMQLLQRNTDGTCITRVAELPR